MNELIVPISSSFVSKNLKLFVDRGNGESKIFISSIQESQQNDMFFNNYSDLNKYFFDKDDILEYLKNAYIEFVGQKCNKYKRIDSIYYLNKVDEVSNLPDKIEFKLEKFEDDSRYYIRAKQDDKNSITIVKKLIREIALPKITDLIITKDNCDFKFKLSLSEERIKSNNIRSLTPGLAVGFTYISEIQSPYSRNRILFGAPGTGKSHRLNQDLIRKEGIDIANDLYEGLLVDCEDNYERVTFHPDYSYANFVGTYKPVPEKDHNGMESITYKYVPGPFMRLYVKALKSAKTDTPEPFVLIIEEINRANVAAVFGDIFQLLDRNEANISEYPIQATEDMKKYLSDELGGTPEEFEKIQLPDNLFIWATMNSADQGVFPMDTAFKRRWDFTYLSIDENDEGIAGGSVILGVGDYAREVEWNELRKAINNKLETLRINEDKLLGPYFISKNVISDPQKFIKTFKNKVIMYLFDDVVKHKRADLFKVTNSNVYSKICKEFDEKGVAIFGDDIANMFVPYKNTIPTGNFEQTNEDDEDES